MAKESLLARGWPLLPTAAQQAISDWLGSRLSWWPEGLEVRQPVALVSSRLGRHPYRRPHWFAALRAACRTIDCRRQILLTVEGTAAARYVRHAGRRLDVATLTVQLADDLEPIERWLTRRFAVPDEPPGQPMVYLSSVINASQRAAAAGWFHDVPVSDRALLALAEQIVVLSLRPHGNTHRALRMRLRDPRLPRCTLLLPRATQLCGAAVMRDLQPYARLYGINSEPITAPAGKPAIFTAAWGEQLEPSWASLMHWTRECAGPWPGQTEEEYLDDLLLQRAAADHSALAVLMRIVQQQRLLASNLLTRGSTGVVCFTEVPLDELRSRRVFRSHLARWDFEPYGLCIRRSWLQQAGARPVQYGNESLWRNLPPADRPFFQQQQTRRAGGGLTVDWCVEREWRVVGDVDLSSLPSSDALVFVPTPDEAQRLRAISRWPVQVVR